MELENYLDGLQALLGRIKREQASNIKRAGQVVAAAISAGGIIHTFGTGHSHLIAHEAFFRAGGIAPINPILDEGLIFLKGALESTRAERESGLADELIAREDLRNTDAAIIISNSGRNAVPVEMALGMTARGVKVIAITSLEQSLSSRATHSSGRRLCDVADVTIDNCVPKGDALLSLPKLDTKLGPSSTVAGAAIINSIIVEAVSDLLQRGEVVPVLPSANIEGVTAKTLRDILIRYKGRIKHLDVDQSSAPNDTGG